MLIKIDADGSCCAWIRDLIIFTGYKTYKKLGGIMSIVFIMILCIQMGSFSESPPDTQWTRAYGDDGVDVVHDVVELVDGYILCGVYNWPSDPQVYILRLDQNGDTLWTKKYGGWGDDEGEAIIKTFDGGYLVVGETDSYGAGGYDFYILKLNQEGDTLWTKVYGTPDWDIAYGAVQTSDSNYIIVGDWQGGICAMKLDRSGNIIWNNQYPGRTAYDIKRTMDGNYIITGDTGDLHAFLLKIDEEGNTLWIKEYDLNNREFGREVQLADDGGYIIAGSIYNYSPDWGDFLVIRTDSTGNILWTRTYGGSDYEWGYSIDKVNSGGYIIAGGTYSFGPGDECMYIVRINDSGDTLWTKWVGGYGEESAHEIIQTSDNGYILAGFTTSFGTGGGTNAYIVKLLPDFKISESIYLPHGFPKAYKYFYNVLGQRISVLKIKKPGIYFLIRENSKKIIKTKKFMILKGAM